MSEGNSGELSPGQRLAKIEERLEKIELHLDERITRHKERQERQVIELANFIRDDFGSRVKKLEEQDVADAAVKGYRKWFVGAFVGMAGLLVTVLVLLIQLMGEVT